MATGGTTRRKLLLLCSLPAVMLLPYVMAQQAEERVLAILLVRTRAEAEGLLERARAGEDFEQLARVHSLDPTAADGGYLGPVNLDDLLPELRQAASGIAPGGLSSVFATRAGYMLVKVLEAPRPAPETRSEQPPQLVAYVSGFEESLQFFSRFPKDSDYHQDLSAICELKKTAIATALRQMEADLERPGVRDRVQAHHTLAQLYSYLGEIDAAIGQFEGALRVARETGLTALATPLEEKLAIAWLRKGEVDNCVLSHNAKSCIFPLTPEARHRLEAGSRKAVGLFLDYLRANPGDLEGKWLLNLALMTLQQQPGDIPPDYRLDPQRFGSSLEKGQFIDVAMDVGLHRMNNAGGSVIEDFDGDGLLDLAISVVNACEPMGFYRNKGDGTFAERSREAGLASQPGGINLNHTDYNNDGIPDLFVMRGGWEFPMRNSLLRGNPDGTFTDVTAQAGLAEPAYRTPTAAWADFDNDGHADLFIGNESAPGQLFRNQGDGTFVDVAARAGVNKTAFTKAAVWGDYDNDGLPDLYVSNYEQENFLYRNNGDGTFTDVARRLGVEKPLASFPAWFFDYDNDGFLDLFVSSYVQSVREIAAEYQGAPVNGETMRLYRNTGKGGFEDVTGKVGLSRISMAMGANFGDIDNDGYLDFYLGTGSPSYGALVPNLLFWNNQGKGFFDITVSSGTGHLQKGHGISFGDLDGDGDQDIFLHTGGAVPGDTYSNVLFRNPGHGNQWLGLRLAGVRSNRAAIGARIRAEIDDPAGGVRAIHRVVSSGGSFGASSFEQHLGLGKAERVRTLEIYWPASRTTQTLHNLSAGQIIEVTEFKDSYRKLERKSFRLGAGQPHHTVQ